MSDLFQRLADRALGQGALVRPLLAPLLLPRADAPPDRALDASLDALAPPRPAAAQALGLRRSTEPRPAAPPLARPAADAGAFASPATRADTIARAGHEEGPTPLDEPRPREVEARRGEPTQAQAARATEPPHTAELRSLLPADARERRTMSDPSSSPLEAGAELLMPPSASAATGAARGAAGANGTLAARSPAATPRDPFAPRSTSARTAARDLRGATAGSEPPEAPPVVHVTIGRIDVRAIMPAPLPARAAAVPSHPALPLDVYLARRERGDRGGPA